MNPICHLPPTSCSHVSDVPFCYCVSALSWTNNPLLWLSCIDLHSDIMSLSAATFYSFDLTTYWHVLLVFHLELALLVTINIPFGSRGRKADTISAYLFDLFLTVYLCVCLGFVTIWPTLIIVYFDTIMSSITLNSVHFGTSTPDLDKHDAIFVRFGHFSGDNTATPKQSSFFAFFECVSTQTNAQFTISRTTFGVFAICLREGRNVNI